MTLLHESQVYRLWLWLLAAYDRSALHRFLSAAGRWCWNQADTSCLLRPLCREGALARAWPDSFLCRLLSGLAGLPAWVLHGIYRCFQGTFDGSFFARLAFQMGEETAIAQFWLIMLLWMMPYKYWNNAYTMLAFGALLALFHLGAMRRRDLRPDIRSIGFYPLVLLGAILLGRVFSCAPASSGRFLLYHLSAALCVLVTVSAVRCGQDLIRLAAGGSACVLVASLYGVYQRLQGIEVSASYVDLSLNVGMPGRVFSFYDNPNTFAEMLMLLLPLTLALVFCARTLLGKAAAAGMLVAGTAALGMTYSRASWVGAACALVVLVFLWKPKMMPLFAVLCILAIPLLPDTIWNRILTIGNFSDSSTASRIPLYQAALRVIRQSPVSGAGLGTAAVQSYIKTNKLYFGQAPFVHAHNFYLQVWMEAGLLGIVSFLAAMLWNIKQAARTVRRCPPSPARTIACAGAASLCGAMVCGLADYLWHYPRVLCIFWFVFAMTLAGVKLCRAEAGEGRP